MSILVTGASGFVGSAIMRQLLDAGHEVRVLLRSNSPRDNLEGLDVEIVIGDLTGAATLKKATAGCSALFHAAADYRLWTPNPDAMYATNVDGTRNIMRAALDAGVQRIVYTSSVATLGIHQDGAPADEATPSSLDDMIGHYKHSKFMAETVVKDMVAAEGLPAVIVNPSTPVGPRDIKPTPTGKMILDAARGHMPAYVNTGLNIVHVDDVAAGHLLALDKGMVGERYILGGENMSLKDILSQTAVIAGRKPPRIRLPHNVVLPFAWIAQGFARLSGSAQPIMTVDGVRMAKKHMYYSSAKAERELAYTHRSAAEALRDAVNWFRCHGYLQ
ncbi:MAG: NAD-dependent epimerase/dehydratase family protein [Mariprofundaceae bacterium]|nr:NAD-dependent epimerase/dehydratase family protein [Mariprofundaceae bacterium]